MADSDSTALRELSGDLSKARKRVGAKGAKVVRKIAADIEAQAKINTPVDTGNLKNSISTDITGDGRSAIMSAEIGPTAAYGAHVEYGSYNTWAKRRLPPQPYMNPAADRFEPVFEKAVELLGEDVL